MEMETGSNDSDLIFYREQLTQTNSIQWIIIRQFIKKIRLISILTRLNFKKEEIIKNKHQIKKVGAYIVDLSTTSTFLINFFISFP